MRANFLAITLALGASCAGLLNARQTPGGSTAQPQAASLLSQSVAALIGTVAVSDVTLTGTAEWIAGSDNETGTVTYKSVVGANRLDLFLNNGTRTEIRSTSSDGPTGTWVGPDGVSHPMANHNVMSDSGWFPTFTLGSLSSLSNNVVTYIGQETRNGSTVIHIAVSQQFPSIPPKSAAVLQHLSQADIYLDPSTLLPVSYVFNSHPDGNALLDIPTEIRYSNYRAFGGVRIPLHVQKYVNNNLVLDLQFQNASLNAGITAAQIGAQ